MCKDIAVRYFQIGNIRDIAVMHIDCTALPADADVPEMNKRGLAPPHGSVQYMYHEWDTVFAIQVDTESRARTK